MSHALSWKQVREKFSLLNLSDPITLLSRLEQSGVRLLAIIYFFQKWCHTLFTRLQLIPPWGRSGKTLKEDGSVAGEEEAPQRGEEKSPQEGFCLLRLFSSENTMCCAMSLCQELLKPQWNDHMPGEVGFLVAIEKDTGLLVPAWSGAETEPRAPGHTGLPRLAWRLVT